VRAPPDEKGRRPLAKGAAKVSAHQQDHHHDHTPDPDQVVVDMEAFRWRPWSGWWGGREMACWSFAEWSRRIA
jgi:hypothetical protein